MAFKLPKWIDFNSQRFPGNTFLFWEFLTLNILIPGIFFITVKEIIPLQDIFQFNTDEGIELAKVDLYQAGYSLYQQIWNDQPPLPTVLWSFWLKTMGRSLENARTLTLCFATLLVWSISHCIRLTVGTMAAIIGAFLLILSINFLFMSSSVMMGLPSLSLMTVAIYCLLGYKRSLNMIALALSAVMFVLALQMKAFVAFLIPVFLFYILTHPSKLGELNLNHDLEKGSSNFPYPPLEKRLLHSLLWLLGLIFIHFLVSMMLPQQDLNQTVGGHFNTTLARSEHWKVGVSDFLNLFLYNFDLILICIATALVPTKKSRRFPIFPLIWFGLTTVVLSIHQPLWSHYSLLMCIPLVWLAAYGITNVITPLLLDTYQVKRWLNALPHNTRRYCLTVLLLLILICFPLKVVITTLTLQDFKRDSIQYQKALNVIKSHQRKTQWLFTDIPMFAFQSNLKMPPEVAVFSKKRLSSQHLTSQGIASVFKRYQPEQVLLGRFLQVQEDLKTTLRDRYAVQYSTPQITIYLRKDLAQTPGGKKRTHSHGMPIP